MNRKNDLFYEVLETTFNSDRLISFMDRFALQINKKTIVILDNSPIHKSKKFINKLEQWKEKDLLIYFLPHLFPRTKPDRNPLAKNEIFLATIQLLSLFSKSQRTFVICFE
jgi:hypothetical protein